MGGVWDKMRMVDLVEKLERAKVLGMVEKMECGKIADAVVVLEVVDDLGMVGSLDRLQVLGKARLEGSIRIDIWVVLGRFYFLLLF